MRIIIVLGLIITLLSTPAVSAFQGASGSRGRKSSKSPGRKTDVDQARIEQLSGRMQTFINLGRTAGIVTLVAHRGSVVGLSAAGFQDLETKQPMRTDSIFQVASMTKPVTAVGIMMLVEEGRLALTDQVQKYLPKFAELKLIAKAAESEQGSGLSEVRKPSRPITIIDLLTHTSGMSGRYPDGFQDLFNKRNRTLAEAVDAFPKRPLEFEPGTRWGYSNMGIATLGRIIEVASGRSYEEFVTERIFQPLGMKDSHFFPPESKRHRIAAVYQLENDKLTRADVDLFRIGAIYPEPEGGLYSTAPDLFRFYQMMLNGGSFNGQRLLSKASVELMTRVHTGSLNAGFSPGLGFGLGWAVVRSVEGMFRLNSIGTYGHGGLYRTYGFVDPQKELIGIILMQRVSADGDMADEINAFMAMASAAVLN
ncbi:MAG TPA: serine hydrolase domain-containing protein [Blastocatellia bacterium]|nr:serine hydrolase domain-containing protein [Blastocatellia bacterium]